MKTTVITLEPFDDITSARDKMSWCRSGRILLVLPEDFRILESRLDLNLLKRYTLETGVQLGLASTDPEVIANARQLGIPIFQSAAVAQKLPWRRTRFRRDFMDQPRRFRLAEQQAGARQHPSAFWRSRWLRIASFCLALLAVAALVGFFLPSATVTLPEVRQTQSLDLAVWASPAISVPQSSGGLPALETTVIVNGTDQAPASGRVVAPLSTANGRVKFTNLTSSAVIIPSGAVVVTAPPGSVRFEVLQAALVPAGLDQVAFATVQAVNKGAVGNVGAGQIMAIEGALGLQLSVTNLAPTVGGEDVISNAPSQADYQSLHAHLLQTLAQTARQEFQNKLSAADHLADASVDLKSILTEKVEPAVGQPGDSLRLTLQVEFKGWYYHQADLEQVEKLALDAGLPPGMTALGDAPQSEELSVPQIDQETLRWQVRASRPVRRAWDQDAILKQLVGLDQANAAAALSRLAGSEASAHIFVQPAWWPWLPSLLFRISLVSQ